MHRLFIASSLLSATCFVYHRLINKARLSAIPRCGICILFPCSPNSKFCGILSMRQIDLTSPLEIVCNLSGLNANSDYGLQLHEFGDLTQGINSLGQKISQPNSEQKLGEMKSDRNGNAIFAWKNSNWSLFGVGMIFGNGCSVWKEKNEAREVVGIGNIARSKEFINIAQPLNLK